MPVCTQKERDLAARERADWEGMGEEDAKSGPPLFFFFFFNVIEKRDRVAPPPPFF